MSQDNSPHLGAVLSESYDASKALHTEGAIRAAHTPKKARLRPVPFCDRVLCSKSEAVRYTGIGRRKIDELIAERRLDVTVVDCRLYIRVPSLMKLIDAGAGQRLPEPPQMAKGYTPEEGKHAMTKEELHELAREQAHEAAEERAHMVAEEAGSDAYKAVMEAAVEEALEGARDEAVKVSGEAWDKIYHAAYQEAYRDLYEDAVERLQAEEVVS